MHAARATRVLLTAGLTLVSAAALLVGCSSTKNQQDPAEALGGEAATIPIFDAHMHYKEDAWAEYPVKSVVELMDQSGVAMALVSSTPDDGTIMLWKYAPQRIVPELRPYYEGATSGDWTKAPDMEAYIEKRLADYPHQGIGEFHIHTLDTSDEPLFRKVIEMAKSRKIPLHVHSGAEPVRWLFSLDNDITIIWAHAGLGEAPSGIHALMTAHPNLYADTSLRDNEILGDGAINAEWMNILVDHQDRLMVGSDTWVNGQWAAYADIVSTQRKWLALVPKDIAEKIAYKNAERLFGRKVTSDLIGTR